MGRVLIQQPGTNTAKALTETLPKNVIIVDEDLKELRLHDGVTPGGKIIGQSTGSGVPIGTIIPFAGNSIPQGYLLCDGSAISRTNYASLFAVIGTIYGAGDGSTTFNLPSYTVGETLVRGQPGWHTNGMVPNITGYVELTGQSTTTTPRFNATDVSGSALYNNESITAGRYHTDSSSGAGYNRIRINASRSSDVYNDNTTYVRPAGIGTNFCIKY